MNGVGLDASTSCTVQSSTFTIPDYCDGPDDDKVKASDVGYSDNAVSARSANLVRPQGVKCLATTYATNQINLHNRTIYTREIYNLCIPPATKLKLNASCISGLLAKVEPQQTGEGLGFA